MSDADLAQLHDDLTQLVALIDILQTNLQDTPADFQRVCEIVLLGELKKRSGELEAVARSR